jgi:hypothetical protein
MTSVDLRVPYIDLPPLHLNTLTFTDSIHSTTLIITFTQTTHIINHNGITRNIRPGQEGGEAHREG